MKYFLFFILTSCFVQVSFSQITTDCFEITSILVDGCAGSEEGKNEMVGFRVGPNPINVSDLGVDAFGANGNFAANSWPNNPFLGFCTDPQATANLQILNDAIIQCGQLLEPPGGVIPAGANVIIITSTDFSPITTYFENLTETIYVIFQCAGNTAGHFVNFGSGANNQRTLILNHLPSGCSDTVSYDRTLLIDAAGLPAAEDGGAVSFDFDNNPTYFNNGCQAPFNPVDAIVIGENSITNGPTACEGGIIQLTGIISGDFIDFTWSGGNGTFLSPNNLITDYQLGAGDVGSVTLTLTVNAPCNVQLIRTFIFTIDQPFTSPLTLNPNGNITLCNGQSVNLVAAGGNNTYVWSTGETSSTISVSTSGTYTVTSANACESEQLSVVVTAGSNLTLQSDQTTTTCVNKCDAQATISVVGGSNGFSFLWDANAGNQTTSSVANLCAGTFTCVVSDPTGSCTASIDVTIQNPVPVTYTQNSVVMNCTDECTGQISATPSGGVAPYTILLFDQSGTQYLDFSNLCEGTYNLVVADVLGCEANQAVQPIVLEPINPIEYNKTPDRDVCEGETIQLEVNLTNGIADMVWSTNETTSVINVQATSSVKYYFTLTNATCIKVDSISLNVIDCTIPVDSSIVIFPNIFSPNGDGKNDFFGPVVLSNVIMESFVIVNRWGSIMAEYSDNLIKWDGLVSGKEANDGTYFYTYKYKTNLNEAKSGHGFFQLNRSNK